MLDKADIAFSIDAFSLQMAQDVEKTVGISAHASNHLKGCVEEVEKNTNPDSALFTQLAATQRTCTGLYENIDLLGPKFREICQSVSKLEGKEEGLSEQIRDFSIILSEAKLHREVSSSRSIDKQEIEMQIQKTVAELKQTENALNIKEQENEAIKKLLQEVKETAKKAEDRAARATTEKSEWQEITKGIESNIRTELGRASVIARDQIKAKFDQQIHALVKEKDEKEKDLGKVKEELEKTKSSTVMSSPLLV